MAPERSERRLRGSAAPPERWGRFRPSGRVPRRDLAMGLAAIGVLLGVFVLLGRWRTREQVEKAAFFAHEGRAIEAQVRTMYLLPEHDITADKAAVRARVTVLEKAVVRAGHTASAEGSYALGRAYLALGDWTKARARLESAWQGGLRRPEVAYRLGLVMSHLYQGELARTERISETKVRETERSAAARRYRDPALAYLRSAGSLDEAAPEYVEALLAYNESRYEDARRQARAAWSHASGLYEAKLLEARVALAQASNLETGGDNAAVLRLYADAERALLDALDVGRSDPAVATTLCARGAALLRFELYSGARSTAPYFDASLAACERAVRTDPADADAHRAHALLLSRKAESEQREARDPRTWTARATDAGQKALGLRPDDELTLNAVGWAEEQAAAFMLTRGMDPRGYLAQAEATLERAVAVSPSVAKNYSVLAVVYNLRMIDDLKHGRDPTAPYEKSVKLLLRAGELQPDYPWVWRNLTNAYQCYAEHLANRGRDPRPTLDKARTAERNAMAVDSRSGMSKTGFGDSYWMQAEYELDAGLDPRPSLLQAERLLREARSERSANDMQVLGHLAHCEAVRAEYESRHGLSPARALGEGRRWARLGIEASPKASLSYVPAARLEVLAARDAWTHGRDPAGALDAAARYCERALRIDPESVDSLMVSADISLLRIRAGELRGERALAEASNGLSRAEKALAVNPNAARVLALAAALHLERADRGGPAEPDLRLARESLERALSADPLVRNEFGEYAKRLALDDRHDAVVGVIDGRNYR